VGRDHRIYWGTTSLFFSFQRLWQQFDYKLLVSVTSNNIMRWYHCVVLVV